MYQIHYPHSLSPILWTDDHRQIVSIDPARENFLLRIERRRGEESKMIVFEKINLLKINSGKKKNKICSIYKDLRDFLDKYSEYYQDVHLVIVEKQSIWNSNCTRVAQFVIDYFCFLLKDSKLIPLIVEIFSTAKSKIFNPGKKSIKAKSIEKAIEICKKRNDLPSLQIIEDNMKEDMKADDHADTICQIEAFYFMVGDSTPEEIIRGPKKNSKKKKKIIF